MSSHSDLWKNIGILVLTEWAYPSLKDDLIWWSQQTSGVGWVTDKEHGLDISSFPTIENICLRDDLGTLQLNQFIAKFPFILLTTGRKLLTSKRILPSFVDVLQQLPDVIGLSLDDASHFEGPLAPTERQEIAISDTLWQILLWQEAAPQSFPPFLIESCFYRSKALRELLDIGPLSGVGEIEARGAASLRGRGDALYIAPTSTILAPRTQSELFIQPREDSPGRKGLALEPPLVSVITPTFNRPHLLGRAVASILHQTMQSFEIIIVNDAGVPPPSIILDGDPRIRYVQHCVNKGLAASRNSGIEHAVGKYIAYLDDDDFFYPRHLEMLTNCLRDQQARIGYSFSARRWEEEGIRVKRDTLYSDAFSADELFFRNYIPVTGILHERELVGKAPFTASLKRLEDWDLWRRISRTERFAHLPRYTCEYTLDQLGVSMTNDDLGSFGWAELTVWQHLKEDPLLAQPAGQQRRFEALREALSRIITTLINEKARNPLHPIRSLAGGDLETLQSKLQEFRLEYRDFEDAFNYIADAFATEAELGKRHALIQHNSRRKELSRVSLVVPLYNAVAYTKEMISSLFEHTDPDLYELIIVDNASTDGTPEFLDTISDKATIIRNSENRNFAGACNQGALAANYEFVVFVNSDLILTPGWLEPLIAKGIDPSVGAVGNRQLFPDSNRVHHCGLYVTQDLYLKHYLLDSSADDWRTQFTRECEIVTGACLLVHRDLFLILGGFDESYRNGYEDVDLCLRLKQSGYRVIYTPDSTIYHHVSKSPGRGAHDHLNYNIFMNRWRQKLKPNISRWREQDSGYAPQRFGTIPQPPRLGILIPPDWNQSITTALSRFRETISDTLLSIGFDCSVPIFSGGSKVENFPGDIDIVRLKHGVDVASTLAQELKNWNIKALLRFDEGWFDEALSGLNQAPQSIFPSSGDYQSIFSRPVADENVSPSGNASKALLVITDHLTLTAADITHVKQTLATRDFSLVALISIEPLVELEALLAAVSSLRQETGLQVVPLGPFDSMKGFTMSHLALLLPHASVVRSAITAHCGDVERIAEGGLKFAVSSVTAKLQAKP